MTKEERTAQKRAWREANPGRQKASRIKWKKLNPDKVRSLKLREKYGIGLDEYNKLLAIQNGVCKICGKSDSAGKNLAVDHDHVTKKVRGLLCSQCNTGLGMFQDSIEVLQKAQDYLRVI
jgi:hypothetical protein